MKKWIKKSVAFACVFANAVGLFACGHTHSYDSKVIAGTCKEQGYTLHTCSCGESYQDNFTGYGEHTGGEATCEYKAVCDVCGNPYGDYGAHDFVYSVCTVCWANEGSYGLNYKLNADGESYTVIGSGHCEETHLSIPNYYKQKPVTAIGDYAFYHSIILVELTIPKSIQSIGVCALSACVDLESIVVNSDNENYKSEDGVLYTKDGKTLVAYPFGRSNKSYKVHDGVENISARAFEGSQNLSSVQLPDSLTTIGDRAFSWSSISDVNIPSSVTYIGKGIGVQPPKTKEGDTIYTDGLAFVGNVYNDKMAIAEVDSKAESVKIPAQTTALNPFVFQGAKATAINVDENNTKFSSVDGNLYTKDGKTLLRVAPGRNSAFTVPNTVTEIADGAFAGCKNLNRVYIPASVEKIGANTFDGCSGFQIRLQASTYLSAWFESYDACDVPIIYGADQSATVSASYNTYYQRNEEVYLSAPTINDATATVDKIEYKPLTSTSYKQLSQKTQGYQLPTTTIGWTNILYTLGDIKYKAGVCIRDGKLYEDFEDDDIYNGGQNYYSAPKGIGGGGGTWDTDTEWNKVEVENNNHAMMLNREGAGWEGFHYSTQGQPYDPGKSFAIMTIRIWSSCVIYDYIVWIKVDSWQGNCYVDLAQGWNTVTLNFPQAQNLNTICFQKKKANPTILIDDVKIGV